MKFAISQLGRRGIGPALAGACASVSALDAISVLGIGWKTKAILRMRIRGTLGRRK
jgi:hypothetical protein